MSLEGTDKKQSYLINELKNTGKHKIQVVKRSFLKSARLFLSTREKN